MSVWPVMAADHDTVDDLDVDALDVDALRAETPGCELRAHLNNAGAALPSQGTLDTVVGHLRLEAEIGGYEAAAERSSRLADVRRVAAAVLGVDQVEVAVTTSDTAAWTKAFWGFVLADGLSGRRRVVVDRAVYNSHHLAVLQAHRHLGIEVDVVGPDASGPVDLTAISRALGPSVGLVSVTHVPTHSGSIAPVQEVGELARRAGVPFFLDACQSVGQLPVDLRSIDCDVATVTGRKWLRGPRGTGLLYVRAEALDRFDPPGIDATSAAWSPDGHDYALVDGAARFEEFETSVAAELGLGCALEELLELGIDRVQRRIAHLATHLRRSIDATPGLHGTDDGVELSGIVTFAVDGRDADAVATDAAAAGINVSVSRAENSRLDFAARGLDTVVRASPHAYNTIDELERLLEVVTPGA